MAVSPRLVCVRCVLAVLVLTPYSVLAQCLHLLPRSVNVFCPDFQAIDYWRQTLYPVSLDPLRDHLCIGIRALSGQLRKLKLEGLRISPAIFAGDCNGSYPDWSRLENVDIRYPGLSSTGDLTLPLFLSHKERTS